MASKGFEQNDEDAAGTNKTQSCSVQYRKQYSVGPGSRGRRALQ